MDKNARKTHKQVSALAGKLAESAADSRDNSNKFVKRIRELEDERMALRESVQDLSKRLSLVSRLLEDMVGQQSTILKQAKAHEQLVETTMSAHAKIVGDAMDQEEKLDRAREERALIRKMLDNQEEQVRAGEKTRAKIMNAISLQGQHMESTKKARDQIISSVQEMGSEIDGLLKDVLSIIPKDANGDEMVDKVVKNITRGPDASTNPAVECQTPDGITTRTTVDIVPLLSEKQSGEEDGGTASTEKTSKGSTTGDMDDSIPVKAMTTSDRIMAARGSIDY